MTVEKQTTQQGNGVDFPKKHDEVSLEYTGRKRATARVPWSLTSI
jgi:hypothetical protein